MKAVSDIISAHHKDSGAKYMNVDELNSLAALARMDKRGSVEFYLLVKQCLVIIAEEKSDRASINRIHEKEIRPSYPCNNRISYTRNMSAIMTKDAVQVLIQSSFSDEDVRYWRY